MLGWDDVQAETELETRTLGEIVDPKEQDLPAIKQRLAQGKHPNDAAEYGGYPRTAPLFWAATQGHVEVVDALADAGADLGWKRPGTDKTAMHAAASKGQAGAVRSLAARGDKPAVDARDFNNCTPLHWAAANSGTTAAQALLEAGADASLKTNTSKTALDLTLEERRKHPHKSDVEYAAILKGKPEVAELLQGRSTEPEPASPQPHPEEGITS